MEVKKTARGWEYGGVVFTDERSAQLTKQAEDEAKALGIKPEPLPKPEEFKLVYDGTEGKSFGIFIERILKEQDTSIAQLSKAIGVSRTTLYSWMSAESLPNTTTLKAILEVTKAEPETVWYALKDNLERHRIEYRERIFAAKVSGGN
jgi:DNA-binding XRE family transcriptional regulator